MYFIYFKSARGLLLLLRSTLSGKILQWGFVSDGDTITITKEINIPVGPLIALNPQSCKSWFLQTICTAVGFWYLNLQANRVMFCLNLALREITLTLIRSCGMLRTHWTMYWETSFFHLWDRWSGMSQWSCSIILFTILFCFTCVSLLHPSIPTTSMVLSIASSLSCLDSILEDHVCSLLAYNLAFLYLYICIYVLGNV